jgi:2-amino-4-hydroxy-6-hydroxymethyldihydropteridine diphosphokinase
VVTTRLAPSVLLAFLQAIEARHGRERRERWGDRTLDLDLISYGDVVVRDALLTLPHPRAAERDFVLVPWLSIDTDAELAGIGRADALLERLRHQRQDDAS